MVINLKSQTDLSGFYIIFEGSTNIETKGIFGLSHLTEHLKFKAFEHLENEFDSKDIVTNAYTSSNEIVYHFKGLDEYLAPYCEELYNLIMNFVPTEQQFLDEKRIVIEEYLDSFNDQSQRHYLNLFRKYYNNFSPIGSLEDLENLSYETFIEYIKIQYKAPSKIIFVSKHSKFDLNVNFNNDINNNKLAYSNYNVDLELGTDFKDKSSIMILSKPIDEDFAYIIFICKMLGDGLKSPLYQEIREKRGLTYGVWCDVMRYNNQGVFLCGMQTSNDKVEEANETLKLVFNNPDIYLTQERFDIVKNNIIIREKKNDINRYTSVNDWVEPNEWNVKNILNTITLDKIKEIYKKHINIDNMLLSNDKTEF
jgi:predicted Zn-dependent peptidase